MNMKSCIERYVGERYGLEVTVKEPREVVMEPHGKSIRVHKWQIRIMTAPDRPDLPKQMIKIEVASVPAHTREHQFLRQNYEFLPDGYQGMVITVESREEIMADKLIALVDCPYLRHRDIWDLSWLSQQGVRMEAEWVRRKLTDYKIEDYAANAQKMIERLPEIARSDEFTKQMGRFIQQDVRERTLGSGKFVDAMQNEVIGLLRQARQV
jgi:predicted nucleotidyltransferase component of viral defense system